MGTVIGKAANGVGVLIGNVFVLPIKTVFGRSCEGICSGIWDITCFIEHICLSDLVKLLMVLGLCYITLIFFYLTFKLGICQCVGSTLLKMFWAGCKAYWFTLEGITCFLWQRLRNVKRVNRRRRREHLFEDVEVGHYSRDGSWSTLYPLKHGSKYGYDNHNHHSHRRLRWKINEGSARVKGRSQRFKNSRQLRRRKANNIRGDVTLFKRRRLR